MIQPLKWGTRVRLTAVLNPEGVPLVGTVVAWNRHYDALTASNRYDYNVLIDGYWGEMLQKSNYVWVKPEEVEVIDKEGP